MTIALIGALLWTITTAGAQTTPKPSRPEQIHFSAEDERVQRPITIPDGVLAIISKNEGVQATLETEGKTHLPSNWLSASVVHLNRPDEKDVVVMATGLLSGANVVRFWVFRPTRNGGYEKVLYGPAHDLVIKGNRTNGYKDIELWSATAVTVSTVILKFDGSVYRTYKARSEPIR